MVWSILQCCTASLRYRNLCEGMSRRLCICEWTAGIAEGAFKIGYKLRSPKNQNLLESWEIQFSINVNFMFPGLPHVPQRMVNPLTTVIECMCATYQVFESIYLNDPVTFYMCKLSYSESFWAKESYGTIFRLKFGHFIDHSVSQTFYNCHFTRNQIHALLDRGQWPKQPVYSYLSKTVCAWRW